MCGREIDNMEKKYCECGCGEEVNITKRKCNRFKPNHHLRIYNPMLDKEKKELFIKKGIETKRKNGTLGSPWNIGKKLSEEHRLKLCGKTPWNKGLKWSNEIRNKLFEGQRKREKPSSETRKKMSEKHKRLYIEGKKNKVIGGFREDNSNWLGGKSFEPYSKEFNDRFKEAVKIRDNESCVVCGSNHQLAIHHINYNKLDSTIVNCITLCNNCHAKTNFNREHWVKFFQSLLNKQYGYEYLGVTQWY